MGANVVSALLAAPIDNGSCVAAAGGLSRRLGNNSDRDVITINFGVSTRFRIKCDRCFD